MGLVSRFFFRKLGLGCNFSFRSLECKSYLRKYVHRKSYHRMMGLVSRFFFRKLGLECSFSFRKVYLQSWLESRSSYRRLGLGCRGRIRFSFVVGCSNLCLPLVALGRIRWPFVGLGCSVGRMVGRRHLSFVVGCSKYRFPFWLLVLVRMGVGHLFRQFLHQDWRMGFRGRVPRMRTKPKQ